MKKFRFISLENKVINLLNKYQRSSNKDLSLLLNISKYLETMINETESNLNIVYEEYLGLKEAYEYNISLIGYQNDRYRRDNTISLSNIFYPQEVTDIKSKMNVVIDNNESLLSDFYQTLKLFNNNYDMYLVLTKEHKSNPLVNIMLSSINDMKNITLNIKNNNNEMKSFINKINEFHRI